MSLLMHPVTRWGKPNIKLWQTLVLLQRYSKVLPRWCHRSLFMGGDQTGCQCQRMSLFTVVFKEVSSNVHKACWHLFPSLLLGEELTVPLMFSLTRHRLPHNLLPQHPQPTRCRASRWTPVTPCSSFWEPILSAGGHSHTCSWGTSHLANCVLPCNGSSRGAGDLGQPPVEILQDPPSANTWYHIILVICELVQPYSLTKRATGSFRQSFWFLRWWSTSDTGVQGM